MRKRYVARDKVSFANFDWSLYDYHPADDGGFWQLQPGYPPSDTLPSVIPLAVTNRSPVQQPKDIEWTCLSAACPSKPFKRKTDLDRHYKQAHADGISTPVAALGPPPSGDDVPMTGTGSVPPQVLASNPAAAAGAVGSPPPQDGSTNGKDAKEKEMFHCDYAACPRRTEGFSRKDRFRLHLQETHKEDDGLLLEQEARGKDFLVVEDVRSQGSADGEAHPDAAESRTLIKDPWFYWGDQQHSILQTWPSKNQKKVLVATQKQRNWRHSFTALYWVFDVESQSAEPLDPAHPEERVQLATWNAQSDAVVFTRSNNLFLRKLADDKVIPITTDGGPEYFYGIPDWVYEEEVFSGNSATWWSADGKHVAFLRTNETEVPEYPIQYFVSRPSGAEPQVGEENYPEVRQIKYPKVGS
ncbi:hypothetical protein BN1723_016938, partial [Verticillium longisporum]